MKFDHLLDNAITMAKGKNPKAVKALLNMDDLKLNGDEIVGLNEQLTSLTESDDYLFSKTDKQDKRQGYDPKKGEQNDTSLAKVMAEEMNKETTNNPYEKAWG